MSDQQQPANYDPAGLSNPSSTPRAWDDPTQTAYYPPAGAPPYPPAGPAGSSAEDPYAPPQPTVRWAPSVRQSDRSDDAGRYGQQAGYGGGRDDGQPSGHGQSTEYDQSRTYGQAPTYGWQPDYGQQQRYGQSPGYRQQPGYAQRPDFGESSSYGQPDFGAAPRDGQQPGYGQSPRYGQQPYGQAGTNPSPYSYGGAEAYPSHPPAARKSRTGLIVGIVVLVVAIVGGISGVVAAAKGGSNSASGAPSAAPAGATPTRSATRPAPRTIGLGDGKALLAAILKPPTGAYLGHIDGTDNGVMNLDQLIKHNFDGNSAVKDVLSKRGFAVAAQRDWIDSHDVGNTQIQLIQFKDSSGADEQVTSQQEDFDAKSSVTGSFEISGVDGARGFEESHLDSYGNRRATLIAEHGNMIVMIFIFTPHAFDRSSESSLMARQIKALRG